MNLIAGTQFAEIMFEADWVMKQLALGIEVQTIEPLSKREMVLHQKLSNLGLKPSREYGSSQEGVHDWSRQWLVIKDIKVKKQAKSGPSERFFEIEDIKIGVEARQLEKDAAGILRDKIVQDPNHRAYKFSQKFTELYDEIAEVYPIFKRLKQISKAIAMAQWMWLSQIPVDMNMISELVAKQKVLGFKDVVPSLRMEKVTESIVGNFKQVMISKVFGGVDCQLNLVDLIEDDLSHML